MTSLASSVEAVIRLSGDLDISRASELSRLEKMLAESESVVFDLSKVDYVDTTFLRFLVTLKRHTNKMQPSAIKLVGLSDRLRRIFEVTGLTCIFERVEGPPQPQ